MLPHDGERLLRVSLGFTEIAWKKYFINLISLKYFFENITNLSCIH